MTARKSTAFADITASIRNDIISGALPAGRRVTFAALAKRYGTSQMPIREAIQQLVGEDLLTAEPFKGARVRLVDAVFINNIFDLRDVLKAYLVERATFYASSFQLQRIREIHDEACSLFSSAPPDRLVALHASFNRGIYDIARNPEATYALERSRPLTDALRSKYGYSKKRLDEIARQHARLLTALEDRDAAGAVKWALEASRGARKDLIAMLQLNSAA